MIESPAIEESVQSVLEAATVDLHLVPGTTTTIATVILDGGFVVAHGTSACMNPADFDSKMGMESAIADAMIKATNNLMDMEAYKRFRDH